MDGRVSYGGTHRPLVRVGHGCGHGRRTGSVPLTGARHRAGGWAVRPDPAPAARPGAARPASTLPIRVSRPPRSGLTPVADARAPAHTERPPVQFPEAVSP
jgi:hypothetical protein